MLFATSACGASLCHEFAGFIVDNVDINAFAAYYAIALIGHARIRLTNDMQQYHH